MSKWENIWLCVILLLCFSALFAAAYAVSDKRESVTPSLVGYGCEGSFGPLYAEEEDHFPAPCDRIEQN